MVKKPLAFSPLEPDLPGIEIQWLDSEHILLTMTPHSHQFLQLIYFEQGGGQYQLSNRTWDVVPGDLFLTALNETHDASRLTTAKGWVVLFTAAAINLKGLDSSSYLRWICNPLFLPFVRISDTASSYFNISEESRPHWSERFQALDTELSTKPFGYGEMARSLLIQMLIDIARLTINKLDSFPINAPPLLVKVFDFIESNYGQPISLVDLAIAMNLSTSYLSASIREMTGRTVLEWIKERRMAEARRLLLETDDDIAQIAETVGYQDVTYFIRQFRQSHLKSPQAWRQAHR